MLTVLFGKLRTEAAGSLWLQPRVTAQHKQAVHTLASCLCRAATTTRSSRTRGPWATPWRHPRTRAGSVKSSSRDTPSLWEGSRPPARPGGVPAGQTRAPSLHTRCLPVCSAGKGSSGPHSSARSSRGRVAQRGASSRRVSDAPGVGSQQRVFGNFPAILEWHRKNRCARTFPLHEKLTCGPVSKLNVGFGD